MKNKTRGIFWVALSALFIAFLVSSCSSGITGPAKTQARRIPQFAPDVAGKAGKLIIEGEEVHYHRFGSYLVYQGDIILGSQKNISPNRVYPQGLLCRDFPYLGCRPWPGGTVYYQFADDWGSSEANEVMRQRVREAMNTWQDNGPIEFVNSKGLGYPLVIQNNSLSNEGCAATIGYRPHKDETSDIKLGGRMFLGTKCTEDEILHELGHVLGLYHEHTRPDRDHYIKIYWENIRKNFQHNFDKPGLFAESVGDYNYLSIMHYPCHDPSTGKLMLAPTQEDAPPCEAIDKAKFAPSTGDLFAIYNRYRPSIDIEGVRDDEKIENGTELLLKLRYDGPGTVKPQFLRWLLDGSEISRGTAQLELDTLSMSCGPHNIELQVYFSSEETFISSKRVEFELDNCLQWILKDSGVGERLTAVSFGSMFVTVGTNGTIVFSQDGNRWSRAESPTEEHLWGVGFGGGKYIAVGNSGTVLTSEDAMHWTQIKRPTAFGISAFGLSAVAFGGGNFVAVGFGHFKNIGVILISRDGRKWEMQKQVPYRLWDISYGNGQFIAVGNDGHVLTSANGSNWLEQKPVSSGDALSAVAYSNATGTYVAVGTRGTIIFSHDGSNWSKANSTTRLSLYDVIYGRSRFVTVGYGGTILQSEDGNNWAKTTVPTTFWLDGVAYGNSRFVVVGEKGVILSSK